jgi:WD40 repeat protein
MRAVVSLAFVLGCAQLVAGAAPPVAEKPWKTIRVNDAPGFVGFTEKGKGLLSLGRSPDGSQLRLWDLSTGRATILAQTGNATVQGDLSPDRKTLAVVDWWDVRTYDLGGKKKPHRIDLDAYCVRYSPDGQTLALACTKEQTIRLWNVGRDKVVSSLKEMGHTPERLAYRPDGKSLASAEERGNVHFWDVRSGKRVLGLNSHTESDALGALVFSPDNKALATAAIRLGKNLSAEEAGLSKQAAPYTESREILGAEVKLWDSRTGKLLRTLHDAATRELFVVELLFSPDGRYLVLVCQKTVLIWDTRTWRRIRSLRPGDTLSCAAISPDGKLFAVGCYDKRIYLWKLRD